MPLPPSDRNEDRPASVLLETVARVLAPIVRLLIARGISYQVTSELLKRVYVDSAQRHFASEDATGTQLSLLTGLNRKEIRRLTTEAADEKRPEAIASFASAAHHLWCSDRRWRDRDGNPKPLPRHSTGRQLSFDDLVRSFTSDHRPGAVLDELKRLGYASEEGDMVLVNPQAFLPQQNLSDKLISVADSLEDHANASISNVLDPQPRFLDRFVFSDELSVESVEKLAAQARNHWAVVHEDMVDTAIKAETEDMDMKRDTDMRIRVGMYFYAEKKESK
jgi:hypothetical protein